MQLYLTDMEKNKKTSSTCEFWSESEHACKVCNSGLFIPLDDHIEIYCKTSEHVLCIQYNMNVQTTSDEEKWSSVNRRKYMRIKERQKVSLVRLNESGNIVSHLPEKAHVLDLSMGGMRVNSREILMNDSIVQFTFAGDDIPSNMQTGIAKVRWSCPINNDTLYQVGLAFQNENTMEAIGRHLGQDI